MSHYYKDLDVLLVNQCFLKQNKKYTERLLQQAAVIPISQVQH